MIWTRPLRAGIADHRFIKVLSAVSHGMSTVPKPERMPNDGEFVAVRVLVRREQDKTRSSCRS